MRIEGGRQGALLALRVEEGKEPDDLLCAHNARSGGPRPTHAGGVGPFQPATS